MGLYQKPNWRRWGLSCLNDAGTIGRTEPGHDRVASYLKRHPEWHQKWESEGRPYCDVLDLANAETRNDD